MTGVHHPGEALTTMAGEGIRGKHQREQKRRRQRSKGSSLEPSMGRHQSLSRTRALKYSPYSSRHGLAHGKQLEMNSGRLPLVPNRSQQGLSAPASQRHTPHNCNKQE